MASPDPDENYVYGLPKVPGAAGMHCSRTQFLGPGDGSAPAAKTYFGPGQIWTDESSTYSPPGDWPAAGTLLRIPVMIRIFWQPASWSKPLKRPPVQLVGQNGQYTPPAGGGNSAITYYNLQGSTITLQSGGTVTVDVPWWVSPAEWANLGMPTPTGQICVPWPGLSAMQLAQMNLP